MKMKAPKKAAAKAAKAPKKGGAVAKAKAIAKSGSKKKK